MVVTEFSAAVTLANRKRQTSKDGPKPSSRSNSKESTSSPLLSSAPNTANPRRPSVDELEDLMIHRKSLQHPELGGHLFHHMYQSQYFIHDSRHHFNFKQALQQETPSPSTTEDHSSTLLDEGESEKCSIIRSNVDDYITRRSSPILTSSNVIFSDSANNSAKPTHHSIKTPSPPPTTTRTYSGFKDRTYRLHCFKELHGHEASVTCLAVVNYNTKEIISGSIDGTLRLWDVISGKCLYVYKGHSQSVRCVVVFPLSTYGIASGSSDHTICIWQRLEAKEELNKIQLALHGRTIVNTKDHHQPEDVEDTSEKNGGDDWGLDFTDDSEASPIDSHTESHAEYRHSHPHSHGHGQGHGQGGGHHSTSQTSIPHSNSHLQLHHCHPTTTHTHHTRRHSHPNATPAPPTQSCPLLKIVLTGHKGTVYTLSTLDHGRLASGSADKTIRIWNTNITTGEGQCERILSGHNYSVSHLLTIRNQELVSNSSQSTTLRVWNSIKSPTSSSNPVLTRSHSMERLNGLPRNQSLEKLNGITRTQSQEKLHGMTRNQSQEKLARIQSQEKLSSLTRTQSMEKMAQRSDSVADTVSMRSDKSGTAPTTPVEDEIKRIKTLHGHKKKITVLSSVGHLNMQDSHRTKQVITASEDETIRIWNCDDTPSVFSWTGSISCSRKIQCSEEVVITNGTNSGKAKQTKSFIVKSLAWINSKQFITYCNDDRFRLYHIDGTLLESFHTSDGSIVSSREANLSAPSPAETYIKEGQEDGEHGAMVPQVRSLITLDAKWFVSGSNDAHIKVWLLEHEL